LVEKLEKKVENKGVESDKTNSLSQIERDILFYLTKEFLTVKRIAIRLKTSDKYIYKIRAKLMKKGILNKQYRKVENSGVTFQPNRLHNQQWHINILHKDYRYKDIIKKCNRLEIDGNTVMLYRDVIEIYSNKSFYAKDEQKATWRSLKYWDKIFTRLENDLNIILIKARKQNIKLVRQHYADTNNEIARDCNNSGEKIHVWADEDCKLAFEIDNSFNLHEAEMVHPITAKQDMKQWKKHINDWRLNKPPTLSELTISIYQLAERVDQIAEQNIETASGLNGMTKILEMLLPKVDDKEKDKRLTNYIG